MTGFPLFLAIWNRAQRQTTPDVHLKIAHWLEARWIGGDTRLLLMAFRSCGKSTIVGLFAAWLLWQWADLRILVLAADGNLAAKMVRNTRRIIERHPLTGDLRPERPDQWAADRFTVRRKAEWRDPSMIAFGIGANITGSRADIIICDDVEVPNTSDTAEKREALRDRLAELSFVLVPGGTQMYVGTPHTFDTIYATEKGAAPDASLPFLDGYKDLRVPLLDGTGQSVWPQRFGANDIALLQKSGGPRRFAAQMMLQAQPITDCRLNPAQLEWYDDIELSGMTASAWWDPAFGRGGDGSVVAIVYADHMGAYYLHRLVYVRVRGDAVDEATQQCRVVADLCRELNLKAIVLETNGLGRFLPAILRRELAGAASVVEATSRKPKDLRIIEGFDAVLAARALHVHRDVAKGGFLEEMRNWKPGGHGRDDALDAVAGALSRLPVRMSQHKGRYKAKTEFNVME